MKRDKQIRRVKGEPVQMNRRELLSLAMRGGAAVALAPALWVSGCRGRKTGTKPNVIFIIVDTLRADHVGCCGYKRDTTPNIDGLARQGILFDNAIVPAPWTLPSVGSILTCQYPSVLGIRDKIAVIDPRFATLAEMLKAKNYRTKGIVSHTLLSARLGLGKGFDNYDETASFGHGGVCSPQVTEKAMRFLGERHDRPFFLFIHYFDPHYNYILHDKYNYYPSYKGRIKSNHPILDLWRLRDTLSEDDIRFLIALYDSEIAFTDEHVGKVLDILKSRRLYENSIVIVTGDHGEEFMERGWIGHSITLYQELIRVPLVMKLPGHKPNVIKAPVGLINLVPTVCSCLGLDVPEGLDGRTINLEVGGSGAPEPVFSETFNPQPQRPIPLKPIAFRSIVLGSRKLIYDQINDSKQIFDLSADHLEKNNLSGQAGEQDNRIFSLLKKWMEHIEAKRNQPVAPRDANVLTPEQRKQLESLGYL
jgi:arylsulfatase A-like enzyme